MLRYALPIALVFMAQSASAAPVTATATDGRITLDNGLIIAVVDTTTGQVTSFQQLGDHPMELIAKGQSLYWDANGEPDAAPAGVDVPKKGYFRPPQHAGLAKLASATPDQADVEVDTGPTPAFPFAVAYHFVMKRDLSGLYAYAVLRHPADQPAATLYQTRFVFRTASDDAIFNYWTVGRGKTIRIPRAGIVNKVTDATWLLADGTVKTKYLNSVYFAKTPVYGTIGVQPSGSHGIWMIEPFGDYHNGGPSRQGQTVHDDVLLRVVQDTHFGSSPVKVAAGEGWSKAYGPFLIYADRAASPNALWDDVDRQLAAERAQWPYSFVTAPDYIKARGQVSGQVLLDGKAPQNAQAILSDPDPKIAWTAQAKGYNYWSNIKSDGSFAMNHIVPGDYTLYIDGADQPDDYVQTHVHIAANQTVRLPAIDWRSETHGQTLWQLGTFDRTAGEFRNGDDARGYQMFARYPQQFPHDVDFTIGKSDPKIDWNYAQWSWYAQNPVWHLRFKAPAQKGQATLTVGIASAQPAHGKLTDVHVALNGHEIGVIALPKTGTAGYRGGDQDSPYHVVRFTFDASLIQPGSNDLTFGFASARPFPPASTYAPAAETDDDDAKPGMKSPGQLMYDAIRLEVAPE
ncbi:polysaccharide lyase family protein [Asticcacaulis sp. EMRT-3]|uniref:polysaccharide lyase family protein n=1 Tax=Asticcacaulis sp. EMRT-3 TaxID=3040349 RepID=UPI0024AFF5A1|nr:polysaccharide lyase family protein [Asticcacaulis sp. EMRT-3]MDI7776188.1 polysaccharide lyase family protein [Asticcacaulis sp. EMRT-3]